MEINVKMTSEEFQEFMAYQEDKKIHAKQINKIMEETAAARRLPEFVAASLSYGLEPVEGKPGRFKIINQEHVSDVWDMLEEFMPKKG